ncbi:asparaginase [Longibacter salinarum]|uniref:Isoaspartyl peptidase n=1 Tax=Longibacter salinarum TaxID=1850348 RepID=A0A2A8D207_9BACT|nr:isoaspartyl peptidase/L-asparaginase [Longibacter salinarum]PEN14920.1 asparaginase [Longibacter salinarum]
MDVSVCSAAFPLDGPGILVHGGAWDIPDEALADHRDGLRTAIEAGRAALSEGQAAADVAAEVVAALESHGAFDAGRGAMLNQEGRAQLDAGIMDGASLSYGSVMAVERLANPIRVARRLMDAGRGQVRMLAGRGAEQFAAAEGMSVVDNGDLVCEREKSRYEKLSGEAGVYHTSQSFLPGVPETQTSGGHDTVGCVVRDRDGRFAAATSTGGTPFKPPGRIGDSPLPGAGFYANEDAAVSSTGWGEAIAAVVLAHSVVRAVEEGTSLQNIATSCLEDMHRKIQNPDGEGACAGLIAVDRSEVVWAFTTPRMARAFWTPARGDVQIEIERR